MLQGLDVDPDPEEAAFPRLDIEVVYEDEVMAVINKPSGLLSVPGKTTDYSVATIAKQRWPGALPVHRLDMGTSGLLVVAKTKEAYVALQAQFVKRTVGKRYIALIDGIPEKNSGRIDLPLANDPMNRPRQVVDMLHGKRAVTRYEYISDRLVALWPETGRTHQLRIHCAHPDGLANPIVGDELYGTRDKRLCLHAAEIWFRHPVTGSEMHFETTPNFI
jgi:tRNA pseudouridine32 synthase/23S rRNA pseudouridine746 synthase